MTSRVRLGPFLQHQRSDRQMGSPIRVLRGMGQPISFEGSVSVVFTLVSRSTAVSREDLLLALGLDDDGSPTWELGRPETGATALIVDDNGRFRLHVPLLR